MISENRKMLPDDAGLILQDEVRKVICVYINLFNNCLKRSSVMLDISNTLNIIQSKFIMEASGNDLDLSIGKVKHVYGD